MLPPPCHLPGCPRRFRPANASRCAGRPSCPGAALVMALAGTCLVLAGPPANPAERTALEQVALARARTAMLAQLGPLPMGQGSLQEWLREDVDLDRAVRFWARTWPQQGRFRWYSDGVCEVDVRVTPEDLRAGLQPLLSEYPLASERRGVDEERLRSIARAWPVLWATGAAGESGPLRSPNPSGWEDVTRDGLELARAAATADAVYALLDEVSRLKISNARRLRDFLASGSNVREATRAALARSASVRVRFEPDQVAVAEASIDMRTLLGILTEVCAAHPERGEYQAADFREMALLAERETLTARGLAPPPQAETLRTRYRLIEYDAPAWSHTTARAVGRAEVTLAEAEEDVRLEAARLDGIDQLRRALDALEVRPNVTLRSILGYHTELKGDLALLLGSARVMGTPVRRADGVLEVRVELPLRRAWEIVRRVMEIEEVEPSAGTGTTGA